MYKTYFWFAVIIVPVLSVDEAIVEKVRKSLSVLDLNEISLKLEEIAPNSTCSEDFSRYVLSIGNKSWATQMMDSIEKVPYGILYGRNGLMGNFDECIAVNEGNFTGKYCTIDMVLGPPSMMAPGGILYYYGLCLPSTCMAADIQAVLDGFGLNETNITLIAKEESCATSAPLTITFEAWIVIYVLIALGIIVTCSTIIDVMQQYNVKKFERYELYSSFSLYRNGQQLVKVYDGPGNIGCLHGLRTLTMCWVILCHEYTMVMFEPLMNGVGTIYEIFTSVNKIPISNGFVSVDTFFLLSGLLVTLVFFRSISKTGTYDVPVAMIHRYLRLTPAFAAVVFIYMFLYPCVGKGPIWHRVTNPSVESCHETWWIGLLYVQNWIKPSSNCLAQSWYLSSDMQMFWLSPILLYPLLLGPVKSLIFLAFGLASALTINFVVAVIFQLGPLLFATQSERQFDTDYVQTHMRMTPYIVGMAVGYVICGIKGGKIKVKLSKTWVIIGWMTGTALSLGSLYGAHYFMKHGYDNNYALAATYLTFHRLGWSLGISWIIFACVAGYGGPINHILSWGGFQILGKISYCMFLVHFPVQMAKVAMLQSNVYAHDLYFVTGFLSTLTMTIMFAVPAYLLFEAPFSNLDRYFLRNLKIFPCPRKSEKKLSKSHTEESAVQ